MTNNLLELYKEIYKSPQRWSYYSKMESDETFDFSMQFAKNLIVNYFDAGGKGLPQMAKKMSEERYCHTLSVFFLGIRIYERLNLKSSFSMGRKDIPFQYYWFLTSLCHDIAVEREKNGARIDAENNIRSRLSFLDLPKSLQKQVNYTPDLLEKYSRYIRKKRRHCEHGIIGAILLFEKLKCHHCQVMQKLINSEQKIFTTIKGVNFSDAAPGRFKQVASMIACHNIWFASDSTKQEYEENSLQELIGKHLDVYDDALLFWILIIADTIEPTKRGGVSCYKEILQKISIAIPHPVSSGEDLKCSIKLRYDKSLCESMVDYWYNSIKSLESWTNIKVEQTETRLYGNIKVAFDIKKFTQKISE